MSADTIFLKSNLDKFDVIFGMYHDQVLDHEDHFWFQCY